jgi:hypothetical protein
MSVRTLLAAAALSAFAFHAVDASAGVTRREAVHEADADSNGRIDKKEAKTLKKVHPEMYDNLLGFCEAAVEHPKQNGVDMPDNPSKDQMECKKKHFAKPYLMAWIAQTEQVEAPPAPEPPHDNLSPSGGNQ